MAVSMKSAREIELMREAGRLLSRVHDELGAAIRGRVVAFTGNSGPVCPRWKSTSWEKN